MSSQPIGERNPANEARAAIFAVLSGKGGVGKSNISVNLGIAAARAGKRVVLLDAEPALANIAILLDLARPALGEDDETAPPHDCPAAQGLRVACGASQTAELNNGQPLRQALLRRGGDDCEQLIIDCGSDLSETTLRLAEAADRRIIVTTPEPTAIADAYATLKTLRLRGMTGGASLIVNMARNAREAELASVRLRRTSKQFLGLALDDLGYIPFDPHVARAVRERSAVSLRFPRCAASVCLARIARRLLTPAAAATPAGVWSRVASLFL